MLNHLRHTANGHQKLAKLQGDIFHQECIRSLDLAGFEIADEHVRLVDVGIELDCVTNNKHGIAMPWEFKGSWQGDRPGLIRTDTLKKAIANGYLLTRSTHAIHMTPLLVMTTHFPEEGAGLAMLRAVASSVVLAFVDSRDSRQLRMLYEATEQKLIAYSQRSPEYPR